MDKERMKLIGNIFGFDCVACEHNRHCYGGNMGNQFRYCQKSMEKLQSLDKLQQENQKLREIIEKIKDLLTIKKARCYKYDNEYNYAFNLSDLNDFSNILKEYDETIYKMLLIEQGSGSNDC